MHERRAPHALHARDSAREDTPFWRHCRTLPIPEALDYKLRLFRARGHIVRYEWETFLDPSWLAMYTGFDVLPASYDPLVDYFDAEELRRTFASMRQSVAQAAQSAPTHAEFIARYCAAPAGASPHPDPPS